MAQIRSSGVQHKAHQYRYVVKVETGEELVWETHWPTAAAGGAKAEVLELTI